MAKKKKYVVYAEAHTDDYVHEVAFDALPWLKKASDQEILDLAACEFGGDYPADNVALFMEGKAPLLARMFSYLRDPDTRGRRDAPGFEVHVREEDVVAWLKKNRPHLVFEDRVMFRGVLDWWPES